jgi:hypothetical protein
MKKNKKEKSILAKLLLVFCFSFFAMQNTHAQVCFETHVDYLTGINPNESISVDFNNDGNLDLIVPNESDYTITVHLGNGAGVLLAPSSTFTVSLMQGPVRLAAGLINADGFLDLVYVTNSNNAYVLLNNGAGGFTGAEQYLGTNARNVTTGDFNSDGFIDIVTCNTTANVSLYLGDGLGNFGTNTNFNAGTNPLDVVAADIDGDSDLDLVTCNQSSNNISVLIGNGSGGFAPRVNYSTLTTNPGALVCVDLDLDGDKDIVVSNWNSSNIAIFRNNGGGAFSTSNVFNIPSGTFGITSADFNLDGKPDIAVSFTFPTHEACILEGDGMGSFKIPVMYSTDVYPRYISSGDYNNDGRPDIVTSNFASSTASVLINKVGYDVQASATDTIVCNADSIKLIGIGATSYTWEPSSVSNGVNFAAYGVHTYTVTGTINGCINTDTITISTIPKPYVYLPDDYFVCAGQPISINACCQADIYTLDPGVVAGAPFIPVSDATYHLTGTNFNGCVVSDSVFVSVVPLPVPIITTSTPICIGAPATLYATSSTGGHVYNWVEVIANLPGGNTPDSISTIITQGGWYQLTLIDTITQCSNRAYQTINFDSYPTVTASYTTSQSCTGVSAVVSGSGASTYNWTGGITDGIPFSLTSNQTYTVVGFASSGCSDTTAIAVNMPSPVVPEICTVDIDDLGNNNIVYWDKTNYGHADTFFVYRDIALNNYQIVAKIPYEEMSLFVDTVRVKYFPNTGDPRFSSFRYKLQIKDTCGNLSPMSLYHSTMFLQDQLNSNFIWSHYEIEGQPQPVPSLVNYLFIRDNDLDGIFETVIGSTTSNVFTDGQYFSFNNTADWRVETNWSIGCNPTLRINGQDETQTVIVKSKSNIKNNRTVGVKSEIKNIRSKIKVYPNPATDILNVEISLLNEKGATIRIENMLGQVSYEMQTNKQINSINTMNLISGVYFVKVDTGAGISIEKIVIE